ncbi:MAG: DUF4037 domain-containing protein [Lachnospiraceae bacterium]|nr:DUF4037 domain-containing protein [Lachnospiraceae bacterium]
MNGMELAERYYETYGRPMLHEKYPEYETRIAVGLVGEGSECFGFDDRISRDHDFGPAFCLWLEKKDYQEIGSRLQKDYEELPAVMAGLPVRRDNAMTGHRTGVWETGDFYRHFLGRPDVPESPADWLGIPDSYLAVATNGKVFRDDAGTFSRIRDILRQGYPESVRIKKLVARAAVMSQSGQYNYPRCVNRGEMVAASLALAEFMRHAMEMVYLLNNRYAPFYKWMHRGLGDLERLGELQQLFTVLADTKNPEIIEEICGAVAVELNRQGLTRGTDPFLQVHLNEIMSRIPEPEIRGLHWLAG